MAEKRKSLGRGLDALLGGATQEQKNNTANSLNELPIEAVGPGPFQQEKKLTNSNSASYPRPLRHKACYNQ